MLAFLFAFFYIDADGHGPGGDHSAEAAHHGGAARISLSKEDRNSNYCRIGVGRATMEQQLKNRLLHARRSFRSIASQLYHRAYVTKDVALTSELRRAVWAEIERRVPAVCRECHAIAATHYSGSEWLTSKNCMIRFGGLSQRAIDHRRAG